MFKWLADKIVVLIGSISWEWLPKLVRGRYYNMTDAEWDKIRALLTKDYYIILTRRTTHLSTYAINISHLFLTGRFGYYSHALMNLEDEVKTDDDFRLFQATRAGVWYAPFDKVFDVDSTVLLKPKNMTLEKWTAVLDKAKQQEGKKYDTLYDLADEQKLSCVELVRLALKNEPNYATDFANFEAMIRKYKNLDPHMFYECPDFEIAHEFRH